jgi:GrpB-like predicted nucleotidyltransferase (UPF0157 family)
MHAVGSDAEADELFERWLELRAQFGDRVDVLDLYELLAEARGVAPEELPHEDRRSLASRALEVIWPGFEQVAALRTSEHIEVVSYRAEWPARFDAWHDRLAGTLGDAAIRIDHIGSTSVPGLAAKPVIDIQVSVADLADERSYVPGCEAAGLELYTRDDVHRFLTVPSPAPRDVHVHVCYGASAFEHDHLLFRDYLRAHVADRNEYAAMKRQAAKRWAEDRLAYTYTKSGLILDLLDLATAWESATGWRVEDSAAAT